MIIRRLLVYFLIVGISNSTFAQMQSVDSLRNAIFDLPNDSSKVNAWNELCLNIWDSDPDRTIEMGQKSLQLAEKIKFMNGAAQALKIIGMGYFAKGNYWEVLRNWQKSLDTYDSINNQIGVSNLLMNIGSVYLNQGDNTKALDYYFRSLRVAEEINNKLRVASAYLGIGNVFSNKEDTYDKALDYFSRGLQLSEELQEYDAIGNASVNIGEIFYFQKQYDSALFYFEKSLEASNIDGATNVPYTLNNIGKVNSAKNQFSTAIINHKQALEFAEKINDNLQKAQSYIGIGNAYKLSKRFDLALDPYLRAEDLCLSLNALKELQTIYTGLALSYSNLNNFTSAFNYQTKLTQVNFDIYNAENDKKLERLQFAHEMENKQREIEGLTKDKLLQEANMKRQRFAKNAFLAGLILIIFIALILYRNYKNKAKTNKLLDKQNQEIESLLLNILPEETAKELQQDGYATPRSYESVSVLFTDFKSFTKIAEGLKPHELIAELNSFFNAFDDIIEKYKLEKIKTIGDAYMCAGGIPVANNTHPERIVKAGLEMQEIMKKKNELRFQQGKQPWELRIGIHTGPVVAGVVGRKKYAYDIWGDTVNIASRMESNGEVGKVNISAITYSLVKDKFKCSYRGKIEAKNKGNIDMYFLEKELVVV